MWLRELNRDIDTPFSDTHSALGVWSADAASIITSTRDGKVIGRHIATGKDEELVPAGSIKNSCLTGRVTVDSLCTPKSTPRRRPTSGCSPIR